jgi:hypothetical protein
VFSGIGTIIAGDERLEGAKYTIGIQRSGDVAGGHGEIRLANKRDAMKLFLCQKFDLELADRRRVALIAAEFIMPGDVIRVVTTGPIPS